LEGFQFLWTIEEGGSVVKIVSSADSAEKSTEFKRNMEFNKMQSDTLNLKGTGVGKALISVRLQEEGYEHLNAAYVNLVVTEPFVLVPAHTVFILPTSSFQFRLAKVKLNQKELVYNFIDLPSGQYAWETDPDHLGIIKPNGLFHSRRQEGPVQLIVTDRHIENNTAEGSIEIVTPFRLDIEIADLSGKTERVTTLNEKRNDWHEHLQVEEWDNNWMLVQGHVYYLKIFLFDKAHNNIKLTENLRFKTSIPLEYFEVIKVNHINSEMVVRAVLPTPGNDKIILKSHLDEIISTIDEKYEPE